ncbi:MAG: hypothetical protein ABSA11_17100 [Candidatus Bathyarchaeia archaeon]|jgi:uncharacterized protein YtpQ (UPF0354 family)
MNGEKLTKQTIEKLPEHLKEALKAQCNLQKISFEKVAVDEIEKRLKELCANNKHRITMDMEDIAKNYPDKKEGSEENYLWYLANILATNIIKAAVFEDRGGAKILPSDLLLGFYDYPHIVESKL